MNPEISVPYWESFLSLACIGQYCCGRGYISESFRKQGYLVGHHHEPLAFEVSLYVDNSASVGQGAGWFLWAKCWKGLSVPLIPITLRNMATEYDHTFGVIKIVWFKVQKPFIDHHWDR